VLAYRRFESSEILILAIKKHRSINWGIPKGKVESPLSFAANAAKEAFEEAGVKGRIMDHVILWSVLLIPVSWLISLAILLHDEWRARNLDSREKRYLSVCANTSPLAPVLSNKHDV
jgi:8-oxo-dGTP pyrophosphatase MutT (NUDIX family)